MGSITLKFTKEKETQIINLYQQGMNQREIADHFNTYNTSIRRVLLRNNVPIISVSNRLCRVKENPFQDLTDPITMYWLGYLCADGCVSPISKGKNSIRINTNLDPDHLQSYADWIGYGVRVDKTYNKRYKTNEYCVGFANKDIASHLHQLGVTNNKSKSLKVNFNLTWDFVRGYFDGDGCIAAQGEKVIIFTIATGSSDFADQLLDFISSEISGNIFKYSRKRIYEVRGCSKQTVSEIYEKLYEDALVYMPRKYAKYSSLIHERY